MLLRLRINEIMLPCKSCKIIIIINLIIFDLFACIFYAYVWLLISGKKSIKEKNSVKNSLGGNNFSWCFVLIGVPP